MYARLASLDWDTRRGAKIPDEVASPLPLLGTSGWNRMASLLVREAKLHLLQLDDVLPHVIMQKHEQNWTNLQKKSK